MLQRTGGLRNGSRAADYRQRSGGRSTPETGHQQLGALEKIQLKQLFVQQLAGDDWAANSCGGKHWGEQKWR
jgi:hypothetical protein